MSDLTNEIEKEEKRREKKEFVESEDGSIVRKKRVMPSQQEIEQKLHELNLTTDPKLRDERGAWFVTHHIKLLVVYGRAHLLPAGMNASEVHAHLKELDTLRGEMIKVTKLLKDARIDVEFQKSPLNGYTVKETHVQFDEVDI